jgi:pimeloyl-ACP methyl ester carboxylesterase
LLGTLALGVTACSTLEPQEAVPPPPPIALAPCPVRDTNEQAQCGTLTVFENRATRTGRTISLNVLVLRATGDTPAPDPVFLLVGGPGGAAASSVNRGMLSYVEKFRRERDVVFVDQRGTGRSHPLSCRFADGAGLQDGFNDLFPLDKIRACRERHAATADVTLYTTPIAMDDLDDVRTALGYAKVNLYGISYGAQAALQYLRQHPTRVRSMVLAGVSTPASKMPLSFARAAEDAMRALMADCGRDSACHAAFPNLKEDFARVLTTLDAGPVTVAVPRPNRPTETIRMSREVFVERLRLLLYDLRAASRVPMVIHRAAHGDWLPFITASLAEGGGVTSGVSGMYMTITCSETMARIAERDIVRESRETFVGEPRTRKHLRACEEWPRAKVPASYYAPVKSDVPVLMLSGEIDASTPAQLGTVAARTLSNARQILLPNTSHRYGHACMNALVAEFFVKGSAGALDIACASTLKRPPFTVQ